MVQRLARRIADWEVNSSNPARHSKKCHRGSQLRTLRKWRQRFLETLSVHPRKSGADQSHRRVSDELRQSVVDSFHEEPRSSQRQVSREVGLSLSSVNRIVKTEGLHGTPWNFTPVQELKDACLLYTSPSPRDGLLSRMPSSA